MTDAIIDQPLPGMPEPAPLWAVHLEGPDDIIPMPSREEADRFKSLCDDLDARRTDPLTPAQSAVVVPWPGTAAEHTEALLRESEEV